MPGKSIDQLFDLMFTTIKSNGNGDDKCFEVIVIPKNLSPDAFFPIWIGIRHGIIVHDPKVVAISANGKIPRFPGKKVLVINVGGRGKQNTANNVLDHHLRHGVCSCDLFVERFKLTPDNIEQEMLAWVKENDLSGEDIVKNRTLSKFSIAAHLRELKQVLSPEKVFSIIFDSLDAFYAAAGYFQNNSSYPSFPLGQITAGPIKINLPLNLFGFAALALLKQCFDKASCQQLSGNGPHEILVLSKDNEVILERSMQVIPHLLSLKELKLNGDQRKVWEKINNQLKAVANLDPSVMPDYDRLFSPNARLRGTFLKYGFKDGVYILTKYLETLYRQQYDFHILAPRDFAKTKIYKIYSPVHRNSIMVAVSRSSSYQIIPVVNSQVRQSVGIPVTVIDHMGGQTQSILGKKGQRIDCHIVFRGKGGNQIFSRLNNRWVKIYWLIEELARLGISLDNLMTGSQNTLDYLGDIGQIKEIPYIYRLNECLIVNRSLAVPDAKLTLVPYDQLVMIIIAALVGKPPKYFTEGCLSEACRQCSVYPYRLPACYKFRADDRKK